MMRFAALGDHVRFQPRSRLGRSRRAHQSAPSRGCPNIDIWPVGAAVRDRPGRMTLDDDQPGHCRARMTRATRSVYSLKRLSAGLSNLGSERKSATMSRCTPHQRCCDAANVRPFGLLGEAEGAIRSDEVGTTATRMPTMTLDESNAVSSTELGAASTGPPATIHLGSVADCVKWLRGPATPDSCD
jgi:hypothetical protein